ncbi:MAG: hypothetical protein RIC03_02935 [Cyclobacteriaceae bacterium]
MIEENKEKRYLFFKQNSELEILLSAAIIFAALKMDDGIAGLITGAINANVPNSSPLLIGLAVAGLYLSTIMPLSIVIHFTLRIYWLSLMGLKSAFPQENHDLSKYSDYFQKVVGRSLNLDKHIRLIDKISSSLFAFSFLSLFAFCFSFISFVLILEGIDGSGLPEIFSYGFAGFMLIYAFDFFSLGRIKRIRWKYFQYVYVPVYWTFNVLTLSFLYRGIYYTFIHSLPRYIIGILLPFYIFLALFLFNLGYTDSGFYPTDAISEEFSGNVSHPLMYDEEIVQRENVTVQNPFIPSYIIDKNHLELSIPVTYDLEDSLISACGITPFEERGLNWRNYATFSFNELTYPEAFDRSENVDKILACLQERTKVRIDSLDHKVDFILARRQQPAKTIFKTVINLSDLHEGNHTLHVQMPVSIRNSKISIPFYLSR